MEKKLEVSVISPVFNERENLKTFVDSVTKVMNSTGMSWELIVVDDGSDDGSTTVIKELTNQENNEIFNACSFKVNKTTKTSS